MGGGEHVAYDLAILLYDQLDPIHDDWGKVAGLGEQSGLAVWLYLDESKSMAVVSEQVAAAGKSPAQHPVVAGSTMVNVPDKPLGFAFRRLLLV